MSRAYPAPPPPSSPAASRVMKGNSASETKPEVALRSELHRRGLRFRKHAPPQAGVRCRADVVFTRARVAVFVDGCFWHGCPTHGTQPRTNASYWGPKLRRNIERDRENDEVLTAAGWQVIRVWEHETPAVAATRIAMIVQGRQSKTS